MISKLEVVTFIE